MQRYIMDLRLSSIIFLNFINNSLNINMEVLIKIHNSPFINKAIPAGEDL